MLKRILTLLTGNLTSKILQFFYFFWVVRLLPPDDFGIYASCMTIYLILLYPTLEFGTELLITKAVAKGDTAPYFQSVYWKSFAGCVFSVPILVIGKITYGFGADVLLLAAGLTFLRSIEMGNAAYLRGQELNRVESFHLAISRLLTVVLLVLWIYGAKQSLTIQLAFIFQMVGMITSFVLVEGPKILSCPLPQLDKNAIVRLLKEGLPLALNSVAWLIYFKIDILLIGKMVGIAEAGLYEVAYKILETTFVFPGVVMAVIFSHLLKCETFEKYRNTFFQALCFLGITGIVGAVITHLALPIVFPYLFKESQHGVIGIYNILAWVVPFVFLAHLTTQILVIQNKSAVYLKITLSAAVLNLVLNFILIPQFQAQGAAIATLITEGGILLLSSFFVLKGFRKRKLV